MYNTLQSRLRAGILGIERTVPLLDGCMQRYINLDNAASTPVLAEVWQVMSEFMHWYSSVHRGAGYKSRVATQAYEEAREIVAEFVGANPRDHVVIFGKNTTEAINKLSYRLNFQPGDVVLVSQLEHHSNDLPWRARAQVEHIRADAQGRLDEEHYAQLLRQHAGRVKLVAVTGASNVTGIMPPIYRMAEQAHAAGARILVDCAQLAPHRPVHMGVIEEPNHLDYLALSAHKMYAPFGSGALIGLRETFNEGAPDYKGGGTIRYVSMNEVTWADAPDRDEAGSPNVVGAVALAAAMKAMLRIGFAEIAAHEKRLLSYTLQGMRGVQGLKLYAPAEANRLDDRLGVIPFNIEGVPHALVASVLAAEHGIGVRNGCFCAQPYMLHLLRLPEQKAAQTRQRMQAGQRSALPGMVRVSFGMYNSLAEADCLIHALHSIAHGEYQPGYKEDPATGEYHPPYSAAALQQGFTLFAPTTDAASRLSDGMALYA